MAAAQASVLPVEEIAAGLGDRFALLTSGNRTALPRHQTLRAALDWSYNLLNPAEQRLLARLSVFADGWTVDAAKAIYADFEVLPILLQLIHKSLAITEHRDGYTRYRLLETIREYAIEKLVESGEADKWRLRHAEYYLVQAEIFQLETGWAVGPDAIEKGELELDNMRTALAWSQSSPDHTEIGLRLIPAFVTVHCWRSISDEELRWIRQTLAQLKGTGRTRAWAAAVSETGNVLAILSDYATAQAFFEESLSLFKELGDTEQTARMLERLGWLARERGDAATARARLEESFELCRAKGHSEMSAEVLTTHGEMAIMEEDAALATNLLRQALVLFEGHGNKQGKGWVLNHLGHAAQLQGDFARAMTLHEQDLSLFKELKMLLGIAWATHSLAETALSQEDAPHADERLAEALTLFQRLGDKAGMSWCLIALAGAAALEEDPERGARLYGAGEALRERIGCRIAPASRQNRERTVNMLRDQLGEAEFAGLAAEGAKMSLNEAVGFALAISESSKTEHAESTPTGV